MVTWHIKRNKDPASPSEPCCATQRPPLSPKGCSARPGEGAAGHCFLISLQVMGSIGSFPRSSMNFVSLVVEHCFLISLHWIALPQSPPVNFHIHTAWCSAEGPPTMLLEHIPSAHRKRSNKTQNRKACTGHRLYYSRQLL